MRYRTSLNGSTRRMVCCMVARYDEFVKYLAEQREEILHGSPAPTEKVQSGSGDTTESKAERLAALDCCWKARAVRVMDEAKHLMAVDIENEVIRKRIVKAIWDSCIAPRSHPYRSNLCISRRDFFRRRNEFLVEIASNMDMK